MLEFERVEFPHGMILSVLSIEKRNLDFERLKGDNGLTWMEISLCGSILLEVFAHGLHISYESLDIFDEVSLFFGLLGCQGL